MSLAEQLLEDFENSKNEAILYSSNDLCKLEEIDENVQLECENGYSLDKPVTHVAKLKDSDTLNEIISEIKSYEKIGLTVNAFTSIENDPEYKLIVKSNDMITEINNEIDVIHKYTKEIYSTRFHELSTVVSDPIQYFKTVKLIGNDVNQVSKIKKEEFSFLDSAVMLVLGVSASTSQGEPISNLRLENLINACDIALELYEIKEFILKFVESRMPFYAPNLSALVGASVAAKLIGYKGGLRMLAETPGCNMLNIGAPRKSEAHVAINLNVPKGCGYIYWIDAIQNLPKDLRKKTAKLFANKAAMASRIDLGPLYRNGEKGKELLIQIEKTVERWMEPPPVKMIKPLPTPIDLASKRRGGRRYRKRKERLGMTEVRKSANRLEFGGVNDDLYENEMTVNAGRLGRAQKIRAPQADPKTKARVSKTLNQKLQKQNQATSAMWGGQSTVKKVPVAGNVTTVAFTPFRGVEISTNTIIEPKQEIGSKYFSSSSNWLSK